MLAYLVVAVLLSAWHAEGQRRPLNTAEALRDMSLPSDFLTLWNASGWADFSWVPENSSCTPSCGRDRTIKTTYKCFATANSGYTLPTNPILCAAPIPTAIPVIPCGDRSGPCDCSTTGNTVWYDHFPQCGKACGEIHNRKVECVQYRETNCNKATAVNRFNTDCPDYGDIQSELVCGFDAVGPCSKYSWVRDDPKRNSSCGWVKTTYEVYCQVQIFKTNPLARTVTYLVDEQLCLAFGEGNMMEYLEGNKTTITYANCEYRYGEWSACNATCGYGYQTRSKQCYDAFGAEVDLEQCANDYNIKEEPTVKNCSIDCIYVPSAWSECSATCGSGTRTRKFFCVQMRDGMNISVDFDECAKDPSLPKQPENGTEVCRLRDCECESPFYQTSEWGPCSAPCEGIQTRTVSCWCVVEGVTRQENMSVCRELTPSSPPATTRSCGVAVCATYTYRVHPWGDCDSECGPGQRRRVVQCIKTESGVDTVVPIKECTDNGLDAPPSAVENCSSSCSYQLFPWRDCSVTCGGGVQTRDVTCIRTTTVNGVETSTVVSLASCADDPTAGRQPPTQRPCNTQECPCVDPHWLPSDWTVCSVTCGNGTRSRTLQCHCYKSGVDTAVTDDECDGIDRPPVSESCGDLCPCVDPRWVTDPWGPCDMTCGLHAIRRRTLRCRCQRGDIVVYEPVELCDNEVPELKPPEVESCARECPCANDTIRYAYTRWSACDKECDGTRTRKVQCRCEKKDVDKWVEDRVCMNYLGSPPITSESCGPPCQSSWRIKTSWSRCSRSCGEGVQERRVVCAVYANGKLISQGEDAECTGGEEKPPETKTCKGLPEKSVWVASGWSTCSNTCRVGVRHRQVRCVNKCTGELQADRRCRPRHQPVHKEVCNDIPCNVKECRDQEKYYCDQIGRLHLCEDIKFHQHCCQTCVDVLLGKR